MKRSTTIAATVLGLSLALATEAMAVPVTTAFTARIEDGSGPVNGLVNLNFKIFDAATAGTMVWEEMHTGASADEGLVFVALGSIAPTTNGLDETVFTGGALFLEVTVNGDVQSPRVPILSVPYSTHAGTADKLGTLAPGDVALASHNHNAAYAALNHNHDAAYSPLSHNHDAVYAALSHNHNGVYAPDSHTHSEYALTTHNHTGVYAPASHSHSEYALTTHNHSGVYAPASHTHALTCTTVQASGAPGALIYATCASGAVLTGGGCYYNGTATGYEGYLSGNSYRCRVYGVTTVNSYARCCNL